MLDAALKAPLFHVAVNAVLSRRCRRRSSSLQAAWRIFKYAFGSSDRRAGFRELWKKLSRPGNGAILAKSMIRGEK
jgi:hypothetical protein